MIPLPCGLRTLPRRTPQGVRGLKFTRAQADEYRNGSHPARGAWIEMQYQLWLVRHDGVAPRKGCVD